jgi:hypothetical protein
VFSAAKLFGRDCGGGVRHPLTDPRFATRAAEASKQIQKENALALACDAIEAISNEGSP